MGQFFRSPVNRLQAGAFALLELRLELDFRMWHVPPVLVFGGLAIDHHFLLNRNLRSHPTRTFEPNKVNRSGIILEFGHESGTAFARNLIDAGDYAAQLDGHRIRGERIHPCKRRAVLVAKRQMFQQVPC